MIELTPAIQRKDTGKRIATKGTKQGIDRKLKQIHSIYNTGLLNSFLYFVEPDDRFPLLKNEQQHADSPNLDDMTDFGQSEVFDDSMSDSKVSFPPKTKLLKKKQQDETKDNKRRSSKVCRTVDDFDHFLRRFSFYQDSSASSKRSSSKRRPSTSEKQVKISSDNDSISSQKDHEKEGIEL